MRQYLTDTFGCLVLQFAEWDGERESFTVIHNGQMIVADSLALLLSELWARSGVYALELAA